MALAKERALYTTQSTFVQGLDPSSSSSSLSRLSFKDHQQGFLHDELIFSNSNTNFMFEALNFPLQEAHHPLINFKATAVDHHQLRGFSSASTVLSFERSLGYGENSTAMSWIDVMEDDESDVIDHLSSRSYEIDCFKNEEERLVGKEKGLNKRAFMVNFMNFEFVCFSFSTARHIIQTLK